MFKRKKKLTLRQIHELYLLLSPAIPEKEEKYLIDEVDTMMEKMTDTDLLKALEIMNLKTSGNPMELLLLFIRGLKLCNFFEYVTFVRGLKHG